MFVLGDSLSDYASSGIGSVECDSDAMESGGTHPDKYSSKEDTKFKSDFAKTLNKKKSKSYLSDNPVERPHFDDILDQTLDYQKVQEEFIRVKHENSRLKFEIEKQKHEEDRFNKLQMEIDQLTCKLRKMEQSRHVYEDTSNQLGTFLELFSNQLPLSPVSTEIGVETVGRRRTRTLASDEESIYSIHSRRKSTSCMNTIKNRQKSATKLCGSFPALNTSTDCTSDTSSVVQPGTFRSLPRSRNRRGGREEKFRSRSRTVDSQYQRQRGDRIAEVDATEDENGFPMLQTSNNQTENTRKKKKSNFEVFMLKLKQFLLKENKYDLRKDSYKEHSAADFRLKEGGKAKINRK